MHPGQYLDCILSSAHDHWLMGSVPRVHHAIGAPTIAPAHHILFKAICENLGDLISTEVLNLLHVRKARFIVVSFHRDHHLCLAGCAPASFSRLRGTEIGIVHLNDPSDIVRISLCHGLSDLIRLTENTPRELSDKSEYLSNPS
jgi:hypothetical protein